MQTVYQLHVVVVARFLYSWNIVSILSVYYFELDSSLIFYANLTAVSGYYTFPSRNNFFVLLSLCNLDLGIETCFYHGMTEYDKHGYSLFSHYIFYVLLVL